MTTLGKNPSQIKMIIGLGNQGKMFELTRHNVGSDFLDFIIAYYGLKPHVNSKIGGHVSYFRPLKHEIILFQPRTEMNLSGKKVLLAHKYFDIDYKNILISHDELELEVGKIKFANPGTSSKGHNGIRSILKYNTKNEFQRLRIGIGRPLSRDPEEVAAYVLSKHSQIETSLLAQAFANSLQIFLGANIPTI